MASSSFMDRVRKSPTPGACWEWQGSKDSKGYGLYGNRPVRTSAHRHSYEMHVGPIPEGLVLDHLCRNPACVNPEHLEPVTHQENILRGAGVAATNAAKTHCQKGHPFDEDNTYQYRGRRHCRACRREATARWQKAGA